MNPDDRVDWGSTNGQWNLIDAENHKWTYTTAKGVLARDGWMYIENPYARNDYGRFSWFKFDHEGIMEFGWIKSENGSWYHAYDVSDGNLGVLDRGWYQERMDNRWYYLNPQTAVMHSGWVEIGGKWYYFTEEHQVPVQTYFQRADGFWYYDEKGRRPYGSMYQNETTPDGFQVGEDGAWMEQKKN